MVSHRLSASAKNETGQRQAISRGPKAQRAILERGIPNPGEATHTQIRDVSSSGQSSKLFFIINRSDKEQPLGAVPLEYPALRRQNEFLVRPLNVLQDVFLPIGWPTSVSSDYTRYQIYDSLQAFSSTIASLLSSRAVLSGIGVGDSTASPTSALLLHIAQDSAGRISTILFAARLSAALEPETKFYRLLADIFNDISIILDCASPLFPRGFIRVSMLGAAGVLRSLCGVAAGASKASLSVHFASGGDGTGNVGELNAKDASQETVISLLGSMVGSVVVSIVVGPLATWVVLLILLAVHLGMNTQAVRAVRMKTLNRQRANLVFTSLFDGKGLLTPEEVGGRERIFERDGLVRDSTGNIIGWARIGVRMEEIVHQLNTKQQPPAMIDPQSKQPTLGNLKTLTSTSSSSKSDPVSLLTLMTLFSSTPYILYPDTSRQTILISLCEKITTSQQLCAWAHAVLILQRLSKLSANDRSRIPDSTIMDVIKTTKDVLDARWDEDAGALRQKGWDLDTPCLETRSGTRYQIHEVDMDGLGSGQ